MKTYFSDIIPKIQRYSQRLDNLTLLINRRWVVIDDINKTKVIYFFRQNNELIISQNVRVEKAKWEYLDHSSLLIEKKDENYLFKQGFFDENILVLKVDGTDEYAILVNETKQNQDLNSLSAVNEFLSRNYIEPHVEPKEIGVGHVVPNYQIIRTEENHPLFGTMNYVYFIEYEDGIRGKIYKRKKEKTYFVDRDTTLRYYSNINSCICALHYYLTTGNISKKGLVASY